MLTQPFAEALAEAEKIIASAPHVACEQDLAEGYDYLAGSMWYVSLDYISHQTSLTTDQARIDPDGQLRFVISERDPGMANWLELTGHGADTCRSAGSG